MRGMRIVIALVVAAVTVTFNGPAVADVTPPPAGAITEFTAQGLGHEAISGSQSYVLTGAGTTIESIGGWSSVMIRASAPYIQWIAMILPPIGHRMSVGTFRTAPYGGGVGGLAGAYVLHVEGLSRSCISHGEVTIRQIQYDSRDGTLQRFEASYLQYCEDEANPLVGTIAYHATVQPPVAVTIAGLPIQYTHYGTTFTIRGYGWPGSIATLRQLVNGRLTALRLITGSDGAYTATLIARGDTWLRVIDQWIPSRLVHILIAPAFAGPLYRREPAERPVTLRGSGLPDTWLSVFVAHASGATTRVAHQLVHVGPNGAWAMQSRFAAGWTTIRAFSFRNHVPSALLHILA